MLEKRLYDELVGRSMTKTFRARLGKFRKNTLHLGVEPPSKARGDGGNFSNIWQSTLWRLLGFGDLQKKKRLNARGFVREFLCSGMLYRLGKSLKRCDKPSSLHSKKNFLLGGCSFFVSDVKSGGLLGHRGPLCLALGANH